MGLREQEFWDTTPRYFEALCRAEQQRQRDAIERARFVAFFTLRAAGAKVRKFTDVVRFPWERIKGPKVTPESIAELKAFDRKADRVYEEMVRLGIFPPRPLPAAQNQTAHETVDN
ncbi:MAG: hypothetical protein KDC61_05755 [Saprospiraceae bacterium]|nr:hypothetical protein [Saprospiraceae bacterium]